MCCSCDCPFAWGHGLRPAAPNYGSRSRDTRPKASASPLRLTQRIGPAARGPDAFGVIGRSPLGTAGLGAQSAM
jgi:hypothetical protein